MDFSLEPPHSTKLIIKEARPYNAEPSSSALIKHQQTPEELVYCRNHGPVTKLDNAQFTVAVNGLVSKPLKLSLFDLQTKYNYVRVVAALQCAGIRRKDMNELKPVNGTMWGSAAISNCTWGGVRLSDVLRSAGVSETNSTHHACFASHVSKCEADDHYGGSIPLNLAVDPEEDVLLAFEMNGRPLTTDHGGPVRIVAPGIVGARWVKWVDTITISAQESQNHYQQRDYKILPPGVETMDAAETAWSSEPALMRMPINSAICSLSVLPLKFGESVAVPIQVKGYAISGSASRIIAVDLTTDEGKTWEPAQIVYQEGKWSWALWECIIHLKTSSKYVGDPDNRLNIDAAIYSRARDESGNVQQKEVNWNLRGVAYNAWGKVALQLRY